MSKNDSSYSVYLVKCGAYYKVGYTKNIKSRMKSLNTASAQKLELIDSFLTNDPRKDESMLHEFLSCFRSKGEWFKIPSYMITSRSEWFFPYQERLAIRVIPPKPTKPKKKPFMELLVDAYENGDADMGVSLILNASQNQEEAIRLVYAEMVKKEVSEIVEKCNVSPEQVNNARFLGLYRKTITQLRQESGVGQLQTPLDAMSMLDLTMNSLVNQLVLETGDPSLAFELGDNIRQVFEQNLKKELKPTWVVLSPESFSQP